MKKENERPIIEIRTALRVYLMHKLANLLLAVFLQIFLAKILLPSSYGTYALLLAVLLVSERLLSFGIDRTILRFTPPLMAAGDSTSLHWLACRLAAVRFTALLIMMLVLAAGASYFARLTSFELAPSMLYAFAVWYISYSLLIDADAIAQSLFAHSLAATAITLEIVARTAAIIFLWLGGRDIGPDSIVVISASTSFGAAVILGIRLWLFAHAQTSTMRPSAEVDVRDAPLFAASAYASTLGWLITSPGVLRIVASHGLNVVPFAAFSFIQALSVSLQRGLPGLLILPSLEAVLARLGSNTHRERMFSVASLIFKAELICVTPVIIFSLIAGPDLISLISRPEYSEFYPILPAMMVIIILHTIYRICEITMSIQFEHRAFLLLWPLSVASTGLLYFKVDEWGLWGVLLIPMIESVLRVAFLLIAYRRLLTWRALDPMRALLITAVAALTIFAIVVSRAFLNITMHATMHAFVWATIAVTLFLASLILIRPFSGSEIAVISSTLPNSWSIVAKFLALLERPSERRN